MRAEIQQQESCIDLLKGINMERNRKLSDNAKMLRKTMTKEEAHLWYQFLCRYPQRFRSVCEAIDIAVKGRIQCEQA